MSKIKDSDFTKVLALCLAGLGLLAMAMLVTSRMDKNYEFHHGSADRIKYENNNKGAKDGCKN